MGRRVILICCSDILFFIILRGTTKSCSLHDTRVRVPVLDYYLKYTLCRRSLFSETDNLRSCGWISVRHRQSFFQIIYRLTLQTQVVLEIVYLQFETVNYYYPVFLSWRRRGSRTSLREKLKLNQWPIVHLPRRWCERFVFSSLEMDLLSRMKLIVVRSIFQY